MSGAQGQGGSAPQGAPSGDLAPMQMLQSYKSAPDRAAWIQQNQTQAQPVQPWQPPQRMYSQPSQGANQAAKSVGPSMRDVAMNPQFGKGGSPLTGLMFYNALNRNNPTDGVNNPQGAK